MNAKLALGGLAIAWLTTQAPITNAAQIRYRSREDSPSPAELDRSQFSLQVEVAAGQQSGCTEAEIPTTRRIVIDQISGDVTVPADERAVVTLWTGPDSFDDERGGMHHYFKLTDTGVNLADDTDARSYYFNEQPNIFSDGFLSVCVVRGPATSDFTSGANARISISGRLVVPPV